MQSLWMLLACAMFAVMGALVKVAADADASLPEIVLFRSLPSVLLLFFWARATRRTIRPSSWRLHLWRNLSGILSMWLGFFALSHLALPTAISLNYTAPLFIAGWMLFFGGAQRDPVRVLAVLAGFLGVLGVLRPSIAQDQWFAALMGLGAGGFAAIAMMQIRQLGRIGEPEWRTVLLFSLGACCSGAAGIALQGWRTGEPLAFLALTGLGLAGLVGQLAMTRAFGLGSTLLTAALQYMTIIFAALIGVLFWGDRPAPLAWAGMALIIGSGLLSVWRTHTEARALRGSGSPMQSQGISTKEVNPS
ncbi:DMT family transporter [Castellaniella ginsengisoli]|jgi:S-adenosylmethionine uptake transporter|uniref:DMT family transporter n=1 Tax=Castellaniella ginsengisoli TaxID=546114 RepID=A0AB39F1T7_9BURK